MRLEDLVDSIQRESNPYYKKSPFFFNQLVDLVSNCKFNVVAMLSRKKSRRNPNGESKYSSLRKWIEDVVYIALHDPFYTLATKIYWILNGLETFPVCASCKKQEGFHRRNVKTIARGYSKYCSQHCAIDGSKQLTRQTNIQRYGNACSLQGEKQKAITKETWKRKYGIENPLKVKAIKKKIKQTIASYSEEKKLQIQKKKEKTCLEHFGVSHQFKSIKIQEKIKKTIENRYGADYYAKTEKFKRQMSDPCLNKLRIEKQVETKRRNNTLNTSRQEKEGCLLLCQKFGAENVYVQYKSQKYPFHCDYYIKSIDLYIELNQHWSHGGHFYDQNNPEDAAKASLWLAKGTKYYNVCYHVWTDLDLRKARCAIENNLRFLVFWSLDELRKWTESLDVQLQTRVNSF